MAKEGNGVGIEKERAFSQHAAILGVVEQEASLLEQPLIREHKLHEAELIDSKNRSHEGNISGEETEHLGGEVGVIGAENGVDGRERERGQRQSRRACR
ncbi:hypothetical protein NL676_021446 [Syzygium grande]|nr:hypothetical protein NL676_021446 [Syzygium grande]